MNTKYSLEHTGIGLETEYGAWHDYRVLSGADEVATCCMFVWSQGGVTDNDGSESVAGQPDANGLHYGDGSTRPREEHRDLDLSDLQSDALALAKLAV